MIGVGYDKKKNRPLSKGTILHQTKNTCNLDFEFSEFPCIFNHLNIEKKFLDNHPLSCYPDKWHGNFAAFFYFSEISKMRLSDKQMLLSYFKATRNKELVVTCWITGMHFTISAPVLHNITGMNYAGLSPLANQEMAQALGECSYSAGHADLAPSTLAGAFLSLAYHHNIRQDKLSAVEANMILSQAPTFLLSQCLRLVASLSQGDLNRIPRLSLEEGEVSSLKHWYHDVRQVLDFEEYEVRTMKTPKFAKNIGIISSSDIKEPRKEARELLKQLKEDGIVPNKLATVIGMSLQKNGLALIGQDLRRNIIAALTKADTPNSLRLAEIFKTTEKNLTHQETIVSKLLDEPASIFTGISQAPSVKMTLAEVLARTKEKALRAKQAQEQAQISEQTPAQAPTNPYLSLIEEIEEEVNEENGIDPSVEPEYLIDTDSSDALLVEADIKELDFEAYEEHEEHKEGEEEEE